MIITENLVKQIITEEILKENLKHKILNFSRQLSESVLLKEEDIENFISNGSSSDQLKLFFDHINNLESRINDIKAIQNRLKPESDDYKEAEKKIQSLKAKVHLLMQQWNSPMAFEKAQHDLEKAHEEAIQINNDLNAKLKQQDVTLGPEDIISDQPKQNKPRHFKQKKVKMPPPFKGEKPSFKNSPTGELPSHNLSNGGSYLAKKRAERAARNK